MKITSLSVFPVLLLAPLGARAGDLAFSDPANVVSPPAHAIGFPNRDPKLDVLPGFQQPPPGYGEVAFYWWLGDPLTQERLAWQIDQLDKVKGVMGLQINYAHTDHGGNSYGLTFPSEPALFSEPWWKLVGWFMQEAKQHNMAVSLSDYTLGFGQGWVADEVLKAQPDLSGSVLQPQVRDVAAGEVEWTLPEQTLSVVAYRLEGDQVVPGSAVDLRNQLANGVLKWRAPGPRHRLVAVVALQPKPSLDPMNPQSGPVYAKKFFGQFEDRNPGEGGKGLNFFFSDELGFGVGGNLWTARFAEEFEKRKGYDLVPDLAALFQDIGPRTPKLRLDYRDVMVSLTEEGFFKPCFDWHQQRGMIFGCDHGGRGRDVTEFGDYFRTQRWNQGPGCDQPGLSCDVIKNKVASSIAHLYQRPRVWLEGYHSSGWGTNTERLTEATFANFAQGQNLLTLHGLYYSTHGGFWEWAPPCNHFRMPYWAHMDRYMASVQRLSYLLSQGDHRCDVAVIYPVAPMEAGLGGQDSVNAAFSAGQHLYGKGIDFDFMDFESLARAQIADKQLRVSGEQYRVLVLPAMRAARWSTLQKALEFQRAGGLVIVLGALPEASDRAGREDAQLNALVAQLNTRVAKPEEVAAVVTKAFPRDFAVLAPANVAPNLMHRRVGPRDVFMVHNAPQDAECWFRATGKVELWDSWSGATRPLPVLAQTAEGTRLRLPLAASEAQLIVFSPGAPLIAAATKDDKPKARIALDGEWGFELQPTMDNRFGDYHWPPTQTLIGAEARRFRYADETTANPGWQAAELDDSKWPRVTQSFGPKFWKLGPLPADADLDARLAALTTVDPVVPVEIGGKKLQWQPYDFSWQWGVEGDPGHQGYHGLKENVSNMFLCLGTRNGGKNEFVYGPEAGGTRYYLWSSVAAERDGEAHARVGGLRPAAVWLNHQRSDKAALVVRRGANPLLLRYDAPGRGYFVVSTGPGQDADASPDAGVTPFSKVASWIWYPEPPTEGTRWLRKNFDLTRAPALARLRVTCDNSYEVVLNNQRIGQGERWETVQEYDVAKHLRAGRNDLVIRASNTGDSAGVIAELSGEGLSVGTDATWRCAKGAKAAASEWLAARIISNYPDSLWAKHQNGPPQLEAAPGVPEPAERLGATPAPLQMDWLADASVLPFDTRSQVAQPAGWYRFTAPPGLRAMTLVARGKVQVWVDAKEVLGSRQAAGWRFELPTPMPTMAKVALRIEQARGSYGGAALTEPITLECAAGRIALGDWSQAGALECYSGGAWYRKTVTLTPAQARGGITLDLGKVVSTAEVRVNGKIAGVRIAPPWRVDISQQVQPGVNRIEVLVYNTLANHYLTIPTNYRGDPTSGLLGPVALEVMPQD
jgi:hypothetical protein